MTAAIPSLTGAPWTWHAEPFPHIVARDVFVPAMQARLEAAFAEELAEHAAHSDGARAPRRYDADMIPFTERHASAFSPLLDAAFHRVLARATGVHATGDVDGGLHHHAPGSASGWVHNDCNPGWFAPSDGEVNLPDRAREAYKYGSAADGVMPLMRVRAAALIYFLGNGPWRDGDGGETGLYAHERQPVDAPSKRIPPLDNSLLLFRCTPHSYHAFLSNVRSPRRSAILWLHEDVAAFDARWGRGSLVGWH